jgi:hypothetical protein
MNQVGCDVHKVQNAVNGLVPGLEKVLFIFHGSEIDHSIDTIDPACDRLEVIQRA